MGLTQAWDLLSVLDGGVNGYKRGGSQTAYEGKASYEWAGDVGGKVWVSGFSQNVELFNDRANAWDMGATVNVAGFGLTGYYGQGSGTGTTVLLNGGYDALGNDRDSDDWYVQATYAIPGVGTKLGVSYGKSTLEGNSGEDLDERENSMWTIGAYHPITKHLNLVAEYSQQDLEVDNNVSANFDCKPKTISLGAILFF